MYLYVSLSVANFDRIVVSLDWDGSSIPTLLLCQRAVNLCVLYHGKQVKAQDLCDKQREIRDGRRSARPKQEI